MEVFTIARLDVLHNLIALISDDNPDLTNARREQAVDLVIKNGFSLKGDQAFGMLTVNRAYPRATSSS